MRIGNLDERVLAAGCERTGRLVRYQAQHAGSGERGGSTRLP